ncbi:MAG: phosphatidate cytidylyltransferase [Planctomycetes bacterium]|nr:phosphatidate cytidylyltransferase [Planctomycetota bacterium]
MAQADPKPILDKDEQRSRAQRDRYRFGALLIGVVAGAAVVDGYVLQGLPSTLVLALLAILCAVETAAMVRSAGLDPFSKASLAIAIGMVALHVLPRVEQAFFPAAAAPVIRRLRTAELALGAMLLFSVCCVLRARTKGAAGTLGAGMLVVLVPATLLYCIDIRYYFDDAPKPEGLRLLLFLVAVSKVGDIAAYLVGSQIGRHKLIPAVSPGKTWEGSIASLIASTGVAALFAVLRAAAPLTLELAIVAGILINIASQFGDLVESLLKRSGGVKDSGSWVPQFGGAFDMVDSLFLAAPVFYGFVRLT